VARGAAIMSGNHPNLEPIGVKVRLAKTGDRGSKAIKATQEQTKEIEKVRKKLRKSGQLDKAKNYRAVLRRIYKEGGRRLSINPRLFFEERTDTNQEAVRLPPNSFVPFDRELKRGLKEVFDPYYDGEENEFFKDKELPTAWLNTMYEGKKTNFQAILDRLARRYDLDMPGKVGDILDHLSPILEKIPSPTPKNGALSKTNLSALKNFVKEPKREVRDYLREDPDPDTKKKFQKKFEFLSEMIEKEHERLSQPIEFTIQEEK